MEYKTLTRVGFKATIQIQVRQLLLAIVGRAQYSKLRPPISPARGCPEIPAPPGKVPSYNYSSSKDFQKSRTLDIAKLTEYQLQPGHNGLSETFAEMGARYFSKAHLPKNIRSYFDALSSLREDVLGGVVNINTATLERLQLISNIDKSMAKKIVAHRKKQQFLSIADLLDVQGFSLKDLEAVESKLTVQGPSTLYSY